MKTIAMLMMGVMMIGFVSAVPFHPDFNKDGKVNMKDFKIQMEGWGVCPDGLACNELGDLDLNGVVDEFDLFWLLENGWDNRNQIEPLKNIIRKKFPDRLLE